MTPTDCAAGSNSAPSQTLRKIVLLIAVLFGLAFLLVGGSRWPDGYFIHETIEMVGLGLILACIVGRSWCALYIGGRKNQNLVTEGPYSVCRNPLYVFSILGAAGVGAQVGSLVVALVCAFFAWLVFLWTALREEASLVAAFPETYRQYCEQVPRFLPNPRLWRAPETIVVQPSVVLNTFFDALFFLIAIPLAEGLEYLHEIGSLPTWLNLP